MGLSDPRGGTLTMTEREVRTLTGARDWHPPAVPSDLPLTIELHRTRAGRVHVRVLAADGRLLETRG